MYLSSTAPHGMSFQLLQKNRLQIGSVDGLQLLCVCIAEKSNGYITVSFLIHRKQKPDWNIQCAKLYMYTMMNMYLELRFALFL